MNLNKASFRKLFAWLWRQPFYLIWLATVTVFFVSVQNLVLIVANNVILRMPVQPGPAFLIFGLSIVGAVPLIMKYGFYYIPMFKGLSVTLVLTSCLLVLSGMMIVARFEPRVAYLPNGVYHSMSKTYQSQAFVPTIVTEEILEQARNNELGALPSKILFYRTGCSYCRYAVPKIMEKLSHEGKGAIVFINTAEQKGKELATHLGVTKAGTVLSIAPDGSEFKLLSERIAIKQIDGTFKLSEKALDLLKEGGEVRE